MNNKKTDKIQKKPPEKELIETPDQEISIPDELLENIGPEHREIAKRIISTTLIQSGLREHPFISFLKKLTPDHITALIKNFEKEGILESEDRKDSRKTNFKVFFVSILAFVALCCLFTFTNKESTLFELIKIIIPIAGAGLGGYGFALRKRK